MLLLLLLLLLRQQLLLLLLLEGPGYGCLQHLAAAALPAWGHNAAPTSWCYCPLPMPAPPNHQVCSRYAKCDSPHTCSCPCLVQSKEGWANLQTSCPVT